MRIHHHSLISTAPGTTRNLSSFHFGPAIGKGKAYIQASLHADELPGMLVAHHLRRILGELEAAGLLRGEIVLVPVANPVGLAQQVLYSPLGRFELNSGENFNRHYPDLAAIVAPELAAQLGDDPARNVAAIRAALLAALDQLTPANELADLRRTLLRLACDADVVLDLHCDFEAVLHLYTAPSLWQQAEPLARYVGAEASLLADESGDQPFDEACSVVWSKLAERFAPAPVPPACLAATIELRGMTDIAHACAEADARAILAFLQFRGLIAGEAPAMPQLKQPATPLAGSEAVVAPAGGVIVFLKKPGDWVEAGEVVAEIVDPLTAEVKQLAATISGVLYARENRRLAVPGMRLCKIAGSVAFRTGNLLGA